MLTSLNFRILYVFLSISFFSGLIALFSGLTNINEIRLWKEVFAIILIILMTINYYKINIFKSILFTIISFFLVINLILTDNIFNVLYQIKLDIIYLIFSISFYFYIKNIALYKLVYWTEKIVKIIIILGLLNAVVSFLESYFFKEFLSLIGISYGSWGNHNGLKIITTFGLLRSPGFLTGFVQSGTVILFSYTLYLYYRKQLFQHNILLTLSFVTVFIVGIIATTYKTAFLGFILITFFFLLDKINLKSKKAQFYLISSFIFLIFFTSSFSYWLYDIVNDFNESLAYNSIYVRVYLHNEVFNQVNNILELLFGVGYGVNGTFLLKSENEAIPLDSTFIYFFSNYGLVGLILFFFIVFNLLRKLDSRNMNARPVYFYTIYIIALEFFFNNIIANFPINYLLSTIIILTIFLEKQKREISHSEYIH